MSELLQVTSDPFDINLRIRGIDEFYRIYYNRKKHLFELHNLRRTPSFQLILPFCQLDCRVIDYAEKTRVDKIWKEILSIDEFNSKLEEGVVATYKDEFLRKTTDLVKYMDKGGKEIPPFSML